MTHSHMFCRSPGTFASCLLGRVQLYSVAWLHMASTAAICGRPAQVFLRSSCPNRPLRQARATAPVGVSQNIGPPFGRLGDPCFAKKVNTGDVNLCIMHRAVRSSSGSLLSGPISFLFPMAGSLADFWKAAWTRLLWNSFVLLMVGVFSRLFRNPLTS